MAPLDYGDVLRILAARGVPAPCPICNHEDWQALGPLKNLLASVPVADLDGEHVAMGGDWTVLLAFALICRNCGFIRLHSRRALMHFAQESEDEAT